MAMTMFLCYLQISISHCSRGGDGNGDLAYGTLKENAKTTNNLRLMGM